MNSEQLEGAKKLFFILLGIDIVATAIVGFNAFSTVGTLREVQSGARNIDQSMISSLEFWDGFSKLLFLTLIGVGIGLVKWLNACYSFAKLTIGATGFKNEGWTGAGWIIPIFNLFKPYQIINEIYKAGSNGYVAPDGWKKESGSGALLTWWIFWAVTHFIGWIISKQLIRTALRDDITIPQAIGLTELQAWLCMTSLVIAGLWFWVANLLTQRMLDRNESVQRDIRTSNPAPTSRPITTPPPAATEMPTIAPSERREAAIDLPEVAPFRLIIPILAMPDSDDWAFEKVADELETNTSDKVLWTRVFAESGGEESKAKALYIQRRVAVLLEAERKRLAEEEHARSEHVRAVETQSLQDVQDELERIRVLETRREEENRRLKAETRAKAGREKIEAAEKARHDHEQQEASLDRSGKTPAVLSPPKQGMSIGKTIAVVLGIGMVLIFVLDVILAPETPPKSTAPATASTPAVSFGPDYNKIEDAELKVKAATDATSAYHLMLRYRQSREGVARDLTQSFYWGEIAANQGHARAQAVLGWYYTAGIGIPEDKQKGLMWLEKSAAQGDPMGLSNLGWRYQIGDGVPLDYQKAFEYAKRASDLGDHVGRNNLAELYEKGHGVPKDYAKALPLFESVAVMGYKTDAVLGMIRIYADQSGNYNYPVVAYAWVRIALEKLYDKEELQPHMNELMALKQLLEGRLSTSQIEIARVKASTWKKGDYLRP